MLCGGLSLSLVNTSHRERIVFTNIDTCLLVFNIGTYCEFYLHVSILGFSFSFCGIGESTTNAPHSPFNSYTCILFHIPSWILCQSWNK